MRSELVNLRGDTVPIGVRITARGTPAHTTLPPCKPGLTLNVVYRVGVCKPGLTLNVVYRVGVCKPGLTLNVVYRVGDLYSDTSPLPRSAQEEDSPVCLRKPKAIFCIESVMSDRSLIRMHDHVLFAGAL